MTMTKFKSFRALGQTLLAAAMTGGLAFSLGAAEPQTGGASATNSVAASASAPDSSQAAARKQLTGAELYSIHCNRCHPERYPTERTAAQWKTIMLHMQVRASIPGKQARLILQYLQENSGR
jgi:mono/diheme cytochrome c family protein